MLEQLGTGEGSAISDVVAAAEGKNKRVVFGTLAGLAGQSESAIQDAGLEVQKFTQAEESGMRPLRQSLGLEKESKKDSS